MSNDPHIPPGWQPATKPQGFMKVFAGETLIEPAPGMTLRDWFAGQALAAFITAPGDIGAQARTCDDRAAEWAYKTADAMLRAREGKQ